MALGKYGDHTETTSVVGIVYVVKGVQTPCIQLAAVDRSSLEPTGGLLHRPAVDLQVCACVYMY